VDCGVPPVEVIVAGGPAVLVRVNVAGAPTPLVKAVTEYPPAVLFAVKVGAVATPEAFVVTVGDPENVPLAPLPGAENVTETPETGFAFASRTVACSAVENAVLTVAL
jgi:hypothetical protein